MSKITVVMTCFNRREKTVNCIRKLYEGNKQNEYVFLVVDDRSSDGTKEALKALGIAGLCIIDGTGSLFWNGGMHRGVEVAITEYGDSDYVLLANDDVDFYPGVIDRMEAALRKNAGMVLVGSTCDTEGNYSYGGIKYTKGLDYEMIGPDRADVECNTFNANCVLIPMAVIKRVGNLDPYYKHSMGDFDYGFKISRAGIGIKVFGEYVGQCNDNPKEGTWQDVSLGVIKRIKLKESFKGLPLKDWFHYLNKNFGFGTACLRSLTPYMKILLRK